MKSCGECKFLDLKDKNRYDDYYCVIKHRYFPISDSTCSSFEYRSVKTSSPISMGGYCYITTAVCQILGYEDNCEYLNTLRNFRDNFMKKEVDCFTMLEEYKIIGPQIVKELTMDKHRDIKAHQILTKYIIPAVADIKNGKYDEAILQYVIMTNSLINNYHIESYINEEEYTDPIIKSYTRSRKNQSK